MTRSLGLSVIVLVLFAGGWLVGQETIKGTLPAHYGKLGLSDEQKQKVYKIQADYKGKIEKLEKELTSAKADQKKDVEAVLTAGQKVKLKELQTGEKQP